MRVPGWQARGGRAGARGRTGAGERTGERGQASVELVAGVVWMLLAGLIGFQLLAAGYAAVMADHAAEAAALALANGGEPGASARAAVPGWPQSRLHVRRDGGRVAVTLRPPTALGLLGKRLAVSAEAVVRQRALSGQRAGAGRGR